MHFDKEPLHFRGLRNTPGDSSKRVPIYNVSEKNVAILMNFPYLNLYKYYIAKDFSMVSTSISAGMIIAIITQNQMKEVNWVDKKYQSKYEETKYKTNILQ